jgi:FAD/FMN-containing dehydrogenase
MSRSSGVVAQTAPVSIKKTAGKAKVVVRKVATEKVLTKKIISKTAVKAPAEKKATVVAIAKKVALKKTTNKAPVRKRTKAETPTPVASSKLPQEIIRKIQPTNHIKRNPLGHLLMEKLFREAGFRGGVSSEKKLLDAYSTDESIFSIRPQVVIQPKNRHDVEIAAAVVAKETKRFTSLSLTPRAAGTGLSGGSLSDSIIIDMSAHLNKIGEVVEKKDKITITCEPGTPWRDVEKRLKAHNAYLPPYPSSKDMCSIGGAIANNAAGPDSLRYGHCADWIESLDVVLSDGHTYTIKPLTYREYKLLTEQDHEYARIAKGIFDLVSKNEKEIQKNRPRTHKNTAGYPLWRVLSEGATKFKKGVGTFDLTRLIAGSQGTIGIIVNITMRALPLPKQADLVVIPIFKLEEAASVIQKVSQHDPVNIELFDSLTFDLALQNPSFFKKRLSATDYYRVMFSMYSTYHVRYKRKLPEFTLLVTLDEVAERKISVQDVVSEINTLLGGQRARLVKNQTETEMFWQIRRASYSLSKLQDPQKRPAAFLEDMAVPPENLSKFFVQIKGLLKEFNVTATIHGHGGDGHLHFYPLLDFTNKTTPILVEKMAEKFYGTATKLGGSICGEHNDGIIRTPHLSKMFSKKMLELFKKTESIFDPDDIFNPGKKVNPRFDIKETMRTSN